MGLGPVFQIINISQKYIPRLSITWPNFMAKWFKIQLFCILHANTLYDVTFFGEDSIVKNLKWWFLKNRTWLFHESNKPLSCASALSEATIFKAKVDFKEEFHSPVIAMKNNIH